MEEPPPRTHGPGGQAQGSRTREHREQAQAQGQGCEVGAAGPEHGADHFLLMAAARRCSPPGAIATAVLD